MYATREGSAVYHLINAKIGLTVCGLRFRALRLKKKNILTHTPTRPLNKTVCKHCVELAEPKEQILFTQ